MKCSFLRSRFYVVAIFLVLTGVAVRLVFPPFVNLSVELAAGNFTATELFHEFTDDPTKAYMELAKKVIILEGVIASTGDGFVIIGKDMCMVRCIFRKSIYDRKHDLKTGESITLKGVCRGLNMTEVLVTHCIVLNKSAK